MENTYAQLVHNTSSLSTRLADLWQAEEAVGHRLDAWLLLHVRGLGARHEREASDVRRGYHQARRGLRAHLRALGRDVVRLPTIAEANAAGVRAEAAARGLQRLHREITRANARLNRLSRMATPPPRAPDGTRPQRPARGPARYTLELVRETLSRRTSTEPGGPPAGRGLDSTPRRGFASCDSSARSYGGFWRKPRPSPRERHGGTRQTRDQTHPEPPGAVVGHERVPQRQADGPVTDQPDHHREESVLQAP